MSAQGLHHANGTVLKIHAALAEGSFNLLAQFLPVHDEQHSVLFLCSFRRNLPLDDRLAATAAQHSTNLLFMRHDLGADIID